MATYSGIITISGSIGDLTFKNTEFGKVVHEKQIVKKDRYLQHDRTKENTSEFGRAVKSACLLRRAVLQRLTKMDRSLLPRSNGLFSKLVRSDQQSIRGERTATLGDMNLLKGFEFNSKHTLASVARFKYSAAIDRSAGSFDIFIPPFVPEKSLNKSASHFQLFAIAADLDFDKFERKSVRQESSVHAINDELTDPMQLSMVLEPDSKGKLVLMLGIEFYHQLGGEMYPAKNGLAASLRIVEAE